VFHNDCRGGLAELSERNPSGECNGIGRRIDRTIEKGGRRGNSAASAVRKRIRSATKSVNLKKYARNLSLSLAIAGGEQRIIVQLLGYWATRATLTRKATGVSGGYRLKGAKGC
jgi:hypothetical protein